jgi:hypothetical protein
VRTQTQPAQLMCYVLRIIRSMQYLFLVVTCISTEYVILSSRQDQAGATRSVPDGAPDQCPGVGEGPSTSGHAHYPLPVPSHRTDDAQNLYKGTENGRDLATRGHHFVRRLQGYVLYIFYVQNAISTLINTFGNRDKGPWASKEQGMKA